MAQHKLVLASDYRLRLQGETITIAEEIHMPQVVAPEHQLPEYPVFVNNLMKTMPTVEGELLHACVGMAGEAGELLDAAKKVWAYDKHPDIAHIIEELGDLRFYYQAMLNMLELDDADIRAQNMIKLRKRYASGKFSNEQANARADKQEVKPLSMIPQDKNSRLRYTAQTVVRNDAGGELWAPVDQYGRESGDIPTYDKAAVEKRCAVLNSTISARRFMGQQPGYDSVRSLMDQRVKINKGVLDGVHGVVVAEGTAGGLSVKLTEGKGAYKVGTVVHVYRYEVDIQQ